MRLYKYVAIASAVKPEQFKSKYADVFKGDEAWQSLSVPEGKTFTWELMTRQTIAIGIFTITLLTGIIAGSYPSVLLSRFQPAKVMKGQLMIKLRGGLLRKVLVVVQFSLSILLILEAARTVFKPGTLKKLV